MTRFLSSEDFTPSKLWKLVKPTVRETESEEGVSFQLLLIKQVFKNADGTEGVLNLVISDLTKTYEQITAI